MTITATQTAAIDKCKFANGSHLDDAGTTAATVTIGFTPRYIRVDNETDRIMWEWSEGMASPSATKTVAAGTRTAQTTDGITVDADAGTFSHPVVQSKQYRWQVWG